MTKKPGPASGKAARTRAAPKRRRLRLLLCDDHALFREGLAALLLRTPGNQIVAETGSGREAVRLAAELMPDVVLLDVGLPDLTGIEVAAALRTVSPASTLVALSMYADQHYVERMFAAGALAYVLKNDASGELLRAIDSALGGERFLSHSLRAASEADAVDAAGAPLGRCANIDCELLTPREREILRLLARGRRSKDIAAELGISVKTVETYRSRLMHKLSIDSLVGLVKFAIRAGLVTAE